MVARHPPVPGWRTVRSWDGLARSLVQGSADWTVHSVFEYTCNLVAADGTLLAIVTAPAGNAPATLVLDDAPGQPPLDRLLQPGAVARAGNGSLAIEDRLTVEFASATLWSPPPIRLTLPIQQIAERIVRARSHAAGLAADDGFAPLLNDSESGPPDVMLLRASALIDHLSTAIRAQRWDDVLAPARSLSGLGPGLTPSGDDVLAGLALGVRAGLGTLPEPLAEALYAAVEGRTTDLAVARVRHAVDGRADETIHRLLTALVDGPPDDLDASVRAVISYGHSSGADTMVGVDRGLRLGVALRFEQDG